MSRSHLWFTDVHAIEGEPLDHMDALGRFVVDRQPDVIIQGGDIGEFPSLSSFDKGRKSSENKRFNRDVAVVREAHERFEAPISNYNAKRRMYKEKMYKPEQYALGGNHDEGRITTAVEKDPYLEDTVSLEAIGYGDYNWTYVPYRKPIVIDGVAYVHHIVSGSKGYSASGASKVLDLAKQSITVGHDHGLDLAESTTLTGKRIRGLVGGCFMQHTPEYALDAHRWWRGIIYKTQVEDGEYDIEFISLKTLMRLYG